MVDKLRKTVGFVPELSPVAEKGGNIVGHILFSIVRIKTDSENIPVLSLAPMAVLPEYQRQGTGSQFVREGIGRCKELEHKVIVLVGHPNYYPRFGFTPAEERGLKLPFNAPDEAFMVYEIVPGVLEGITGTVEYPPEFIEEK